MPTVPGSTLPQPSDAHNPLGGKPPSQTDLLMALSQMHESGRLNPDAPAPASTTAPVKNAKPIKGKR